MKYKTTIEIISEASNKADAMEIAGEYLSGNLTSGVDMKCRTSPVQSATRVAVAAVAVFVLAGASVLSMVCLKPSKAYIQDNASVSAVQAPLKTSAADKRNAEFKKEWESVQMKHALDMIK